MRCMQLPGSQVQVCSMLPSLVSLSARSRYILCYIMLGADVYGSCSMACSVVHKATHPSNEPLPSPPPREQTPQPKATSRAGTTGFKSPFTILEDSKELRQLFLQFPDLSKHLDSIHSATLRPVEDFGKQQQQPGQRKQQSWNQDRGLALGVEALGKARRQYGKDGEGVREYGRLVLQLLEREAEGGKEIIRMYWAIRIHSQD